MTAMTQPHPTPTEPNHPHPHLTDERKNQIVQLLRTHNDHLPEPTRRDQPPAGFIHNTTATLTCPDCLANDRIMYGCETCHGRGHIEEPRSRDPYAVDKVQPYGLDTTLHERRRQRDAQIARLEQQTSAPRKTEADLIAEANDRPYTWERQRETMRRRYDHQALDQALEHLREHSHELYRLTHQTHIYKTITFITPTINARLNTALEILSRHLPDPLRAPTEDKHPALKRRDKNA